VGNTNEKQTEKGAKHTASMHILLSYRFTKYDKNEKNKTGYTIGVAK